MQLSLDVFHPCVQILEQSSDLGAHRDCLRTRGRLACRRNIIVVDRLASSKLLERALSLLETLEQLHVLFLHREERVLHARVGNVGLTCTAASCGRGLRLGKLRRERDDLSIESANVGLLFGDLFLVVLNLAHRCVDLPPCLLIVG